MTNKILRSLKKKDYFLLIVGLLGFILIFSNLGNRSISGDEALTTLISSNIVKYGYPAARFYETGTLVIDKQGAYASIGGKEYYVWNSWLQYYLAAIPLSIFGMNEFFLRLPFALFGFFSIFLFYSLCRKITKNIWITRLSTILLLASIPFCLHIRQVRWYPLVIFFSLWIIQSYLNFLERGKTSGLQLSLSAIFLFHSNFFVFAGVILCLGIHFVFFRFNKADLKRLILHGIGIFCFTFPWIYLTGQISSKGSYLSFSILKFIFNIVLNSYYLFVFLFPAVLLLVFLFLKKKDMLKEFSNKNYLMIIVLIIGYLLFLSLKMDGMTGIRYTIILIPFLSLILGFIIYKIKEKNKFIAYLLIILLIGTNLLHILPFVFLKGFSDNINSDRISDYEKERFINNSLKIRFFLMDYLYEISHDYDSSDELIINYLKKQGSPNDNFITSSFSPTILLYTNMKKVDVNATKIDWIIVREFKVRDDLTKEFMESVNKNINLSLYEKVYLANREERWAEAPDPVNHRFKTDRNGLITLYHLREG